RNGTVTALCCGLLLLEGCTVGPDYKRPSEQTATSWESGAAPTTRASSVVVSEPIVEQWWSTFGDNWIDQLVERALRSNPDLAIAACRVREARAGLAFVRGAEAPKVQAGGSITDNRHFGPLGEVEPGDYNFYQAGFDASWEVDVFGGTRRAIESAQADMGASVEEYRGVRLSLAAEVTRNYVELRTVERRLAIARHNLSVQERTLELTRQRLAAGVTGDLDVSRATALVANTRATIPILADQAKQAIRRLSILLGEEPDALAGELAEEAPIPQPPSRVSVGLPAELLRRRPDIRAAERRIAAANARVGVAKADYYPQFALIGAIGQLDVDTEHLFDHSRRYYGIGPEMRWDVFNGGRTDARVNAEEARTARALAEYRKTVLGALAEAKNALDAFNAEQHRRSNLADAVAADRRAVRTATDLYRQGISDFLSVLDAERSLAASEDALAQSDRTVTTDAIALYKALGEGWQSTDDKGETRLVGAP
ncbi:MAG: efflux transporter outer membrane subunit, partial [Tepidisphaeraceae bacterium]